MWRRPKAEKETVSMIANSNPNFLILVVGCQWVLTWFTHSITLDNKMEIMRIWDFLIANEAPMIIFLSSAFILREIPKMEEDSMMEVMDAIRTIKFTQENMEGVFKDAISLHREFTYSRKRVETINSYMLEE